MLDYLDEETSVTSLDINGNDPMDRNWYSTVKGSQSKRKRLVLLRVSITANFISVSFLDPEHCIDQKIMVLREPYD